MDGTSTDTRLFCDPETEWTRPGGEEGSIELIMDFAYKTFAVVTTTTVSAPWESVVGEIGAIYALVTMAIALVFKEVKPSIRQYGINRKQYVARFTPAFVQKAITVKLREARRKKASAMLAARAK